MTRPGDRLRALAARTFDAGTMERLIDPVVADMQAEHGEAVRSMRTWRSRSVRIAGYVAFLRVVALCGWKGVIVRLADSPAEDRKAFVRTIGFSLTIAMLVTLALEAPYVIRDSPSGHVTLGGWAIYLIPQGLAIALPVGLTLGIVFGLGGRIVSNRLRNAVLALAIICSVVSFGNVGWVVPTANQAFRVSLFRGNSLFPPAKGVNELTLGELSRKVELGRQGGLSISEWGNVRNLEFSYHVRWAFSCAALVLVMFTLSIIARRSVRRWVLGAIACGAIFGYYVLMDAGRLLGLHGALPAFAAAWLPNVFIVLVSAASALKPSALKPSALSR